jgi:hypothetical protein
MQAPTWSTCKPGFVRKKMQTAILHRLSKRIGYVSINAIADPIQWTSA